LGRVFFKEITEEEIWNNTKKIIISKSGVHDEKALADFMAREQSVRESFDFV
jgi:hypothetical protein